MLRRLSFPCRWFDLERLFGMQCPILSEVFWEVLRDFYGTNNNLISPFRSAILKQRVRYYADSIHNAGAAMTNCVGFLDGTKIQMSRPGGPNANQRSVYTGHKKFHCFLYMNIRTPDGLLFLQVNL